MSPDPLGGDILNPQSLNRYAYVMNNPENFIDPLGLKTCPPTVCGTVTTTIQVMSGPLPTEGIFDPFGNGDLTGLTGVGVGGPVTPGTLGPRGGGGPRAPQTPGRVTQVARCAANLANTMSVGHYAHLENTPVASGILSNDFSSLTNLIFGPGRGTSAGGLAENLGTSPALQLTAKGAGAVPVDSGFQFLFSSVPATTFAETAVGGVAVKALGAAAAALSFESVGQAIYDAGVYAGAVYVCAQ